MLERWKILGEPTDDLRISQARLISSMMYEQYGDNVRALSDITDSRRGIANSTMLRLPEGSVFYTLEETPYYGEMNLRVHSLGSTALSFEVDYHCTETSRVGRALEVEERLVTQFPPKIPLDALVGLEVLFLDEIAKSVQRHYNA